MVSASRPGSTLRFKIARSGENGQMDGEKKGGKGRVFYSHRKMRPNGAQRRMNQHFNILANIPFKAVMIMMIISGSADDCHKEREEERDRTEQSQFSDISG